MQILHSSQSAKKKPVQTFKDLGLRFSARWVSPLRRQLRVGDEPVQSGNACSGAVAGVSQAPTASKRNNPQPHRLSLMDLESRFSSPRERTTNSHSPQYVKPHRKRDVISFRKQGSPEPLSSHSGAQHTTPSYILENQKHQHDFFREGNVSEIEEYLKRGISINFDRCVSAVFQRHSATEASTVLRLIVNRLQDHQDESLDWNLCVREAARHGLLSICVPYLEATLSASTTAGPPPFSIPDKMWDFDWKEVQQRIPHSGKYFQCERTSFCVGGPITAALWRLLSFHTLPSLPLVEEYVKQGAEISVRGSVPDGTLLHLMLRRCSSIVVRTALCAVPGAVDFNVTEDRYPSHTPLHLLCTRADPMEATSVLEVVIERLQQHAMDGVDFGQKRSGGLDFISLAAFFERLALFWPVVHEMPFFADNTRGIILLGKVYQKDWCALGVDEQSFFVCPQQLW